LIIPDTDRFPHIDKADVAEARDTSKGAAPSLEAAPLIVKPTDGRLLVFSVDLS
jgi:hypothetical protein